MSTAVETRRLVAHEKMLVDVIKRQAGTLKKAVLEGTMNSIEAGATEIDINFLAEKSKDPKNPTPAFLSIYDDGIGIQEKEELVKHFETFGQPHEESENKIYAQFRMGRGQMFAFGKNIWKTANFEMKVDIDNPEMELNYYLKEGMPYVDGCRIDIELYQNPLDNRSFYSVKSFKEQVKEQINFVKIPVKFNDEVISINPDTLNWDYEDEFAYYKFNDTSSLKIYNLGVYVMSKSIKDVLVGGVVVSKQQLKVNFARNDVHETNCKVYSEIKKVIEANKIKKVAKSYKSLSRPARMNLLCDFRDGVDSWYHMAGKRLFPTAQQKWLSWKMIVKDGRPWCFTPVGSRTADKAMEMGVALCFDDTLPDELGYSGPLNEFFEWLWADYINADGYFSSYTLKDITALKDNFLLFSGKEEVSNSINLEKLQDMFSEDFSYVPYHKLKKSEKIFLDTINCLGCWQNRNIKIGISNVASAWTDGSSFIAFDRGWLKSKNVTSIGGIYNVLAVGCHELAHDDDTSGTHVHGSEFYERYYEITMKSNQYNNPLVNAFSFADKLKRAKIDDKRQQEEEKDKKLKEELGLVST
jgi:hypothetical protein